jgi:hypothetical protein
MCTKALKTLREEIDGIAENPIERKKVVFLAYSKPAESLGCCELKTEHKIYSI